ncbi:Proteolipid protein 2 [Friedmanniomyces endolithicus]|nr:Proteolipid protein 2 [Friedmanniomyces endolithicus]
MDMNLPVNVPVDDPNADTEWNDILRRHKIIPEKPPSPTPLIEEALTQARQLAHENRLEGKDLEELDELEDDEDEAFLDSYRQKRMQEMKVLERKSVYGRVFPVQKVEYSREVTEESSKAWVCVLLTSSSGMNVESQRLVEVWRELAATWGEVKFCQMRADLCI